VSERRGAKLPSRLPGRNQSTAAGTQPSRTTARPPGQDLEPFRLEVHGSIEPVAVEWDALADRIGATPFRRPGWIDAWWRAFGTGRLEIVVLRRAAHLAAVIPLHRRRRRIWSTSNWHSNQFGILAEDEAAASGLAAALFRDRPVQVSLGFVDTDELAPCRAAAAEAGYRVLEWTLERSPYVVVEGTWDDYAQQRLSRNRRRQLRRCRRRLEHDGRLELDIEKGGERMEESVEEFFRIEASGWKGAKGSAILSRPETRYFYREVAKWAAARGWLRIAFLRLDGRPLAAQYLIEEGNVLYMLKGGYDPAFEDFSPGMVLLETLFRHAFSSQIGRLALLGGDEMYKLTFTKTTEDLVRFQAFAPSMGYAHWLAFAYGRPVAKLTLALLAHRSENRTSGG
jgi:CelD/BcsL family acetyltransferase involved in cellulose biosynthesis